MNYPEPCIDHRIGGCPRYYGSDGRPLMFIHPDIQQCVVFLGVDGARGEVLGATAFFVRVRSAISETHWTNYLVTAKHAIDDIKHARPDGKMFFRVNWNGGIGAKPYYCKCSDWYFHPKDKYVDVAVMPIEPKNGMEWGQVLDTQFLTDAIVEEKQIGIGDDLFIIGLFTNHAGKKTNIPIARIGNLAAMPVEPLSLYQEVGGRKIPFTMDAYLIEARSIGGLSGSPVFVTAQSSMTGGVMIRSDGRTQSLFYLLGVISGHWDKIYPEKDSMVKDSKNEGSVNMGIGIVVPATKIMEVITQPVLAKKFAVEVNEAIARNSPVPDVSN